jgi:hypothetical protein
MWQRGTWVVRASYALQRDAVAAELLLRDVDLGLLQPWLADVVVPLEGSINGSVELTGPLSRPSGGLDLDESRSGVEQVGLDSGGNGQRVVEVQGLVFGE